MLSCGQVAGQVLLGLSGELEEADQAALRAHLEACPACRAQAGSLGESWEAFRSPPLWKAKPLPLPRTRSRRLAWAAAAGLLLAAFLGWRMQPWAKAPRMAPLRFDAPYEAAVDRGMRALARLCEKGGREGWRGMSLASGEVGLDQDLDALSGCLATLSKEVIPE
mgnify:CR=1 FL=1